MIICPKPRPIWGIVKDAIDLIRAGENYNLILIDDVMKPISGLETLKKLRSLDINIPCIIMLDNDKEHIKNFRKNIKKSTLTSCTKKKDWRGIRSIYA